jgi:hypothetical protein
LEHNVELDPEQLDEELCEELGDSKKKKGKVPQRSQ